MLTVRNLVKKFEGGKKKHDRRDVVAVDDVNLDVKKGELFTLLGPSGCGKTTTLRCVAGLESPDAGSIVINKDILFDGMSHIDVPPHRRGLGMVFQSYAIWPHMDVYHNVAFPLTGHRRAERRHSKADVREKVERVLELVQLQELRDRPATNLSGGQQQRLALARALVTEPPVVLLDEPLSNLDAKLREEMRFELKKMQRDLSITSVYVTHDQIEALAMSNVIAVMNEGKVEQFGPPREIYNNPKTRFVADFIGTSNFIEGSIQSVESGGRYLVDTTHGRLLVTSPASLDVGAKVTVSIRPEECRIDSIANRAEGQTNVFAGTIAARAFLGESVEYQIMVGELAMRVRGSARMSMHDGHTDVSLTLPEEACSLIPLGD